MKRIAAVGLGLAALILGGCYTVPETGRQAFILPIFDDAQMGAQAFRDVKAREKISADPQANARVRRVGERIARAVGADLPGANWEFVVFDAPGTVNAFALPGGKVGVYTGLLQFTATDDELAVVMGHEIGHATARHGAQRMTEAVGASLLGIGLSEWLGDARNRDLWLAAYGVGAAGMILKYSRDHEGEADEIGLIYAARAGYDPRAGITFWQRMMEKNKDGRKLPVLLSTHPADANRIQHLQSLMPRVMPVYEQHRKDD
ncbi:MAG: M48 family metallopeptidase [Opitutaceae bacterium]|nr:M48 family metallopeptidase [Opitutaceae bacterium]